MKTRQSQMGCSRKKSTHPLLMGFWKFPLDGGSKTPETQAGGEGCRLNLKKSSGVVISTDNSLDLNIYFGGHLLDGLCIFSI